MALAIGVNQNVVDMEYAVRGPIPLRAAQMQAEGKKTIACNIGNPQALGQQPLSYYRQVLSLVEYPALIERERALGKEFAAQKGLDLAFDSELLDIAEKILEGFNVGTGAYTESKGPRFIREAVASFIDRRDSPKDPDLHADPDSIFLTNGASEAAKPILELLISKKTDGIMIPIPQYPLYSATIRKCGGTQVDYYPDEDSGWLLDRGMLDGSLKEAQSNGIDVKAIVVINPGNPTGAILDRQSIDDVISFAEENGLVIIADEVYQENLYGGEFHSFAKVLGKRTVPLLSLHSISKGFYGECGHRGGYVEVRNPPHILGQDISFLDIMLKQASVSLCSNTVGQTLTYLMVNPPPEGTSSHQKLLQEKSDILRELHKKATMIRGAFKEMKGVNCFGKIGAMYLFPRLEMLPQGTTDFEYCMALLENTGLCTVNGSGFGQKQGTQHLRIAFLPPEEMLEEVLPKWIEFHNNYVK